MGIYLTVKISPTPSTDKHSINWNTSEITENVSYNLYYVKQTIFKTEHFTTNRGLWLINI